MSVQPKWPWPGDSELDRARRIALAYRERLKMANQVLCDTLDRMLVEFGESWVAEMTEPYQPEDAITTLQAAALVGVTPEMIRHWARLPHPDDPSQPLLPRARRKGREMTYRVMHVRAAEEAYRRSQHARAGGSSTRSA